MSLSVKAASSPPLDEDSTIRVVSARTGLPMDTLRVWERRYGFPSPRRREGSNRRLYSATDVERLVYIQRVLERGYRIGDVIGKTVSQLRQLDDAPRLATGAIGSTSALPDIEQLVALLAAEDVEELEAALRRAGTFLGPRRFVTELAHPFVVSIGQAWAGGRLAVRHEHLATECLVTQIRQMLAVYRDIQARSQVLLATLPGEPHTLPLQMVALYLVTSGVKPRLLGASTPTDELVDAARALGADVVGLTVAATADRKETRRALKRLRGTLPENVGLWVGGGGAAALGFVHENVRLVTSWSGIDDAVDALRARS
jgi:DNA-binding transcriptional MerR regulator